MHEIAIYMDTPKPNLGKSAGLAYCQDPVRTQRPVHIMACGA